MKPSLQTALQELASAVEKLAIGSDGQQSTAAVKAVGPAVATLRAAAEAEGLDAVHGHSKTLWHLAGQLWVSLKVQLGISREILYC